VWSEVLPHANEGGCRCVDGVGEVSGEGDGARLEGVCKVA
jgi:hypothetical protein